MLAIPWRTPAAIPRDIRLPSCETNCTNNPHKDEFEYETKEAPKDRSTCCRWPAAAGSFSYTRRLRFEDDGRGRDWDDTIGFGQVDYNDAIEGKGANSCASCTSPVSAETPRKGEGGSVMFSNMKQLFHSSPVRKQWCRWLSESSLIKMGWYIHALYCNLT